MSEHLDTRTAGTEVAHELHDALAGRCDLLITFASFHHNAALRFACDTLRQTLSPKTALACSTESVLGGDVELEGLAGFASLGIRLPEGANIDLHEFTLQPDDMQQVNNHDDIARHIGLRDDHRVTMTLLDPFSLPAARIVNGMTMCRGQENPVPVVGGIASGAGQPGNNVLIFNDQVFSGGGVGVTISGEIDIDFTVSQGCKPIGESMVITKAKDNVILELGGHKAFDVVQETAKGLDARDRQLLTSGLLCGIVIDETKQHHGRGDFLIRNVLGFDQRVGGVAIADGAPLGRTVQFHVRDAQTATEDFELLLNVQEMKEQPFAGMLFTCNGRGTRLFEEPNHDLNLIRERLGEFPIAGFFAGGEIAPIGGTSFIHGHTAALMLMRERA